MRKLIATIVLLGCCLPTLWAVEGCDQHLTREEFRAKQQAFLTTQAGLTSEEAAHFFPIYFELQDQKKKLNDESWKLMKQGKDEKTTQAQYEEIIERVCDNRIAADRLDKSYIDRFKKVLSAKKVYLIQRAELRFHREMLKGMQGHSSHGPHK
ncbi:MAG: hypothetical protein LBN24_00155 [Mediterranea sp.]|jgi:hypothetical protein|nr:hypothetical protein [Mediterranea sp.]